MGLNKLIDDIIITDELGGTQFRKPYDIAFRIMQRRWEIPFEQMLYVGNNVEKDFQAPKQFGIRTLYFENEDNFYTISNTVGIKIIMKVSEIVICLSEMCCWCRGDSGEVISAKGTCIRVLKERLE